MKKRITALLLCALLSLPALPTARAAFDDIADPEVSQAATTLRGLGIVAGTSGNNFTPNNSLTRAEACALIINTMGLSNQVNTYKQRTVFSDVLPASWYTGIVNLAYAKGVVNGYGNGTFGPEDKVTYGHFATMILRLLGYTSEQIGSVWPLDYTAFCDNLELSEGLDLKPERVLTRAQAALLLYRALNTQPNGGKEPYYMSLDKVASKRQVILLDNDVSYGASNGLLMVYALEGASGVDYYEQVTPMEEALAGSVVTLLLNNRGDVMAAVPESNESRDVVIGSAKGSGITGADGVVYRINSDAVTIVGDSSYTWGSNGYVQLNNRAGQTARLFYDNGAVTHVCLTVGTAGTNAQVVVAQTDTAAGELVRKLGVTGNYSITKNGALAKVSDLGRYDTAYYDKVSNTLCASDYQLTGYIQAAQPSMDAAQSITVSGCTVPVLEAAWDTLETFKLGDRVTLLLTDDCKVAAAVSDVALGGNVIGVLSTDGRSVTLCGSELVVSARQVNADESLHGTLVKVVFSEDSMFCSAYTSDLPGQLNVEQRTVGRYELAASVRVYENTGPAKQGSYVYSLEGEQGKASSDFEALLGTDVIPGNNVSAYHLNSAGKVDVLLLRNVTGNNYKYGKLTRYTGTEGIATGTRPTERGGSQKTYSDAATLTNADGVTQKYLCGVITTGYNTFIGIAIRSTDESNQRIDSFITLTKAEDLANTVFFSQGEQWYATVNNREIPVNEQVQVYFEGTDQWMKGMDGLRAAMANGTTVDVHYDSTSAAGAQVRVIQVNKV